MTVVIQKVPSATSPEPAHAAQGAMSVAEKARARSVWSGSLYKPRAPIYPKLVHGKWRNIKWALLVATLTIYYVVPWIRWPRPLAAPQQSARPASPHCLIVRFIIVSLSTLPIELSGPVTKISFLRMDEVPAKSQLRSPHRRHGSARSSFPNLRRALMVPNLSGNYAKFGGGPLSRGCLVS